MSQELFSWLGNKYGKSNTVTGSDVVKYYKCGGYHGQGAKGVNMNAEQTCFGIYMSYIERMLGLYGRSEEYLANPYIQSQIDTICAMLEYYVMNNCIDKTKSEINFSMKDFEKAFGDFKLPNTVYQFSINSSLMPNVVQYILMQNGIQLKNRNILLDSNDFDILKGQKFEYGDRVTMSGTMESIDKRLRWFEQNKNPEM